MAQVVVVIGGGPLPFDVADLVAPEATVIAADSGLDHAVEAGLRPSVLVGDLDSISAAGRMWAYAHGVDIRQFPQDKDATDAELALAEAAEVGGSELLVLSGGGGRLDHTLGSLISLGSPVLDAFQRVTMMAGTARLHVLRPGRLLALDEPPGTLFSLFALHGECRGVDVIGARWPLHGATVQAWSTRGISNETLDRTSIAVSDGLLTVVIP